MIYDFTKQERQLGRIVFALTLDHKRMTERILIGETSEVRRRLNGGNADLYYDETRPLGQFLIGFEGDTDRIWNRNAMALWKSYETIFPGNGARFKEIESAASFLQEKYQQGEPSAMYAAIRTWEQYLNCYHRNHGPDLFIDSFSMLYRPFYLYGEKRPWQIQSPEALSSHIHEEESRVELWYPASKRSTECIVAYASFQPLIFYYLHKIQEWRYVFQTCKVCGKTFLAKSKHYELCSDPCRKVQATEAKRQFDERAKGNRPEQLYESAYYYWYNRLRSLRRANAATEKIDLVSTAFQAFRKEAVEKKSEAKHGKLSLPAFSGWLIEQQEILDTLMQTE